MRIWKRKIFLPSYRQWKSNLNTTVIAAASGGTTGSSTPPEILRAHLEISHIFFYKISRKILFLETQMRYQMLSYWNIQILLLFEFVMLRYFLSTNHQRDYYDGFNVLNVSMLILLLLDVPVKLLCWSRFEK